MGFLPITVQEMQEQNIEQFDFIYVSGDAYVDHPSFGTAIITRVIQAAGYTVGILAQPDWHKTESFQIFGAPKYGFFVSSGSIDSMVSHYTVAKKRRSRDAYSPAERAESGRTEPSLCIAIRFERHMERFRSLLEVWRRLYGVLRTMIIGRIRSGVPFYWILRPI